MQKVLNAGLVTLLFTYECRDVYNFLVAGGTLSLVVDGLRASADGHASVWLYPLWWRPLMPNLYVMSNLRVAVVVTVILGTNWMLNRRLETLGAD